MLYDGLQNCLTLRISNLYTYLMCGLYVSTYHNLPMAQSVAFWGQAAAPFYGSAVLGGAMTAMFLNHARFQKTMITRVYLMQS